MHSIPIRTTPGISRVQQIWTTDKQARYRPVLEDLSADPDYLAIFLVEATGRLSDPAMMLLKFLVKDSPSRTILSTKSPSDIWDSKQLYRLHMIRVQAANDIPNYIFTVNNYLIHAALSDRQRDITALDVRPTDHPDHQTLDVIRLVATSCEQPGPFQGCEHAENQSSQPRRLPWRPMRPWHEQRGHPWSKITTTEQEDVFFWQSPEGKKSNIHVVQTFHVQKAAQKL